MKCVVGVDLERRSPTAIGLLSRLKFAVDETLLLHVTEPMQLAFPYSAYGMVAETDHVYDSLRQSGDAVLDAAHDLAEARDLHARTAMCDGFPVTSLIEYADHIQADLIAVTSSVKSTVGAIFGGSVARGLAISARQSVLVARQDTPTEGPLKVVFATDQSPYCAACVSLLRKFAPKGIDHLTLLTVHEHHRHLSLLHHGQAEDLVERMRDHMINHSDATAQLLEESGIPTESLVVCGQVDEAIHRVMLESGADLLIVGSQGHGFMERMLIGSTSLHQVICEHYPVLLLRPPRNGEG